MTSYERQQAILSTGDNAQEWMAAGADPTELMELDLLDSDEPDPEDEDESEDDLDIEADTESGDGSETDEPITAIQPAFIGDPSEF